MRSLKRIVLITVLLLVVVLIVHSGLAAWSKSSKIEPNAASRICSMCHR